MSTLKSCDKCGGLYKPYESIYILNNARRCNVTLTVRVCDLETHVSLKAEYDLCPRCAEKFCKWIKEAPTP